MATGICNGITLLNRDESRFVSEYQPKVLAEGCVLGDDKEIYCLRGSKDGTAYIEFGNSGRISEDFAKGNHAKVIAAKNDHGCRSVYVASDIYGGITYRVASLDRGASVLLSDNEAWRGIMGLRVPYNIDFNEVNKYGSGCGGSDRFFPDDPILINAHPDGALIVGDYLILPWGIFRKSGDEKYSILDENEILRIGYILGCALTYADGLEEERQILSAIDFFDCAGICFDTHNGSLELHPADIHMELDSGGITIKSDIKYVDVVAMDVNLRPDGFGNDIVITFDSSGVMYKYYADCQKEAFCMPYLTFPKLEKKEKALYKGLLEDALDRTLGSEDQRTLQQVIDVINHPLPANEWQGWSWSKL